MKRREFIGATAAGAPLTALAGAPAGSRNDETAAAVVVERPLAGRPHAGKVLLAIQPHADDIPLFAAGTVAKLLDEGYTGHLVRVTNDDMAGPGTVGETVLANEKDNDEVARVLGLQRVFNLNYNNHWMDGVSRPELRLRFIFLIRLLKVDTVVGYDPWGHYEENPDHAVTSAAVEAACWMAGGGKDYPEHIDAGLKPHSVKEKYYFARGPQLVNRVVDISSYIDAKVAANRVNLAQGPAGSNGAALRKRLAEKGVRLPILGGDDESAANAYIKHILLQRDVETGRRYGLAYAEPYHYIGPPSNFVDEYIRKNAVPAK